MAKISVRTAIVGAAATGLATFGIVAVASDPAFPYQPPTGLNATEVTTSSVKMNWDAVEAAPRYRLRFSTSPTMSNSVYYRSEGSATSRTVTELHINTKYYVKVRVIAEDGTDQSAYSPAVEVKTDEFNLVAPTGLAGSEISETGFKATWDVDPQAPRYRVQLSTASTMANPTYIRSDGSAPNLTVSNLSASTNYYMRVRSITADGVNLSPYSTSVNVKTLDSPKPPTQKVSKVLIFLLENHSLNQVKAGMPYTWGLGQSYGYATKHKAITHPSRPNYIGIFAGSTLGVTNNDPPSQSKLTGPTVFSNAVKNGYTVRTYADGMPSNCYLKDGGVHFGIRHIPHSYFTDDRANCQKFNVPYAQNFSADAAAGNFPNIGLVVPNNCNNAHDCSLKTADEWFKARMNIIMKSPDWLSGKLAVIYTADEDDKKSGNIVFTTVIHSSQKKNVVTTPLTHYSLTRLMADITHSPRIRGAATAPDLAKAFGFEVE